MRKRLLSLCLMAAVAVAGISVWALEKNAAGAYQIGSAADLKAFAELVNGGEVHAWGQLAADIDYGTEQTMIGCEANNYAGTFDGQGHTIKYQFFPETKGCALFRNVGATGLIQNLRVVGSITTSQAQAAGLAAYSQGVIRNCVADVTITSGVAGDATHGGIVAVSYQGAFITNCLAKVTINGEKTEKCGGIVGYADARTTIQNCLTVNDGTFKKNNNSSAFGRNASKQLITFNVGNYVKFRSGADSGARQKGGNYNNFAANAWGDDNVADGTVVADGDLKGGKVCYMLNTDQHDIVWRQTIGEDNYPLPGLFGEGHGQVYASVATNCKGRMEVEEGQEAPEVAYSNTDAGVAALEHTWDNGVCSTCGFFDNDYLAIDPVDGCYMLKTAEDINWCEIKNQVSNGGYFSMKQMADIEVKAPEGYTIFNASNWCGCNYNGQGRNLTIDISYTGDCAALFPLACGVIENLNLHGTIKTTAKKAGSVVGVSKNVNMLIRNVYSDVNIQATKAGDATAGGILGSTDTDCRLENVIYAGKIQGAEGTTDAAGICGYAGKRVQMDNVVMAGTIESMGGSTCSFARNPSMLILNNCWCSPSTGAPVQNEGVSYFKDGDAKSGALAFAVNGHKQGADLYYQTIGTDNVPYPYMAGGHEKVYAKPSGGFSCNGLPLGDVTYQNSAPGDMGTATHDYHDGFCSVCGDVDEHYLTPTEDGWYEIGTPGQMLWWAHYAAKKNLGAKGRLVADIDMQGIDNYPLIGEERKPFYGCFDGQFHVVSNLIINYPESNGVGFIGYINSVPADSEHKEADRDGTPVYIQNLTIDESCKVTGQAYVGGVLGGTSAWPGLVQVKNCVVRCAVTALDGANAGGIMGVCMGSNYSAVQVDNCGVTSTIRCKTQGGVISGWMGSYGTLTNCWAVSNVYEEGAKVNTDAAPDEAKRVNNFVRAADSNKSCKSENNWWLYDQDSIVTNKFKMDIVPTGELAWRLNKSQFRESVWYQRIGDDEVPYLDKSRGVVAKLYDKYYSIYDAESLGEAVDFLRTKNDELVGSLAYKGVRDELEEKVAVLDACEDYLALADAMDTLNVYAAKVAESQKVYKTYNDKCQETIAYLKDNDGFAGSVRDALEAYLTEDFEPSGDNTLGSYLYVVDNTTAPDSLVKKETERVALWLQEAINTGYMAGADVTCLIANPTFSDGFNGWEGQKGTGTTTFTTDGDGSKTLSAGEMYNSTLDMHQTINGLKPGLYLLQMVGAYRPISNKADRYSVNYGATFYANDNANYLMNVIEDPISVNDTIDQVNCNLHGSVADLPIYEDGLAISGDDMSGFVPQGTRGLAIAGNNGRYINYIATEVGEDGVLKLGVKDGTFNYGSDWVGFADLRLTYLGTAESEQAAQIGEALKSQLARLSTINDKYVFADGTTDDIHTAPAYPASLREELQAAQAEAEAAATVEDKMASIARLSSLFKRLYEAKMAYISYYGISTSIENLADVLQGNIPEEDYTTLMGTAEDMQNNYIDGTVSVEEALSPSCLQQEPLATMMPKVDENGTFRIANAYHLLAFSATVSGGNGALNAVLDNDVDMTGYRYVPAGRPNENDANVVSYTGTFDGQQHAITNLIIGSEDNPYKAQYTGLFSELKGGVVKNVALQGTYNFSKKFTGAIAGHSIGEAKVQNCSVNVVMNAVASGDVTSGGLVGVHDNGDGLAIEDCYVHAVMNGLTTWSWGGVLGWAGSKAEVKNTLVINDISINTKSCNSISRNDKNCAVANTYFTTVMNGANIGTQTTFDALKSGAITWGLNGAQADDVRWYQTLGTDTIPHLFSGDKVWYSGGEYVNEEPALELNAFAYNVSAQVAEDAVTVNYTLNAPARAVDVVFYNGETQVAAIAADGLGKGEHSIEVANGDLGEKGTALRYEVKVTGVGSKDILKIGESYKVWSPYGLACNNAPMSAGFGQTYLIETDPDDNDGYLAYGTLYTGYISDKNHSALYAFDQDFNQILNAEGTAGFKGGLESKKGLCAAPGNEYDFKTVRVSKDGRVFVGRGNGLTNSPIMEVNPADLNASWTPVFTGGELDAATGVVWAGGQEQARMVSSFDVEGEGENLKLWVLGNQYSNGGYNCGDYACHTYNLGTASAWTGAASSVFAPLTGVYTIAPKAVNVVSDQKGGLWYIQHRSAPTETVPALKHYNAEGVEDYSDISTPFAQGGMAISADGETFALPTASNKITIYTTDYAPNLLGKIFFNQVGTFTVEETSVSAMAFDYAGNLYVASAGTESVSRYTVPRDNKVVVTPAAQTVVVGNPTGIDSVDSEGGNGNGAIYNVAGQRLQKAHRGVNIIDGKKVMVK